jgi:hypothetical protein
MRDQVKPINGIEELMRDGEMSSPRYEPLEQIYNDPVYPSFGQPSKPPSEFMEGFEECLDTCGACAGILILTPFLLMLAFLSLPILIPYSIYYLVKKVGK